MKVLSSAIVTSVILLAGACLLPACHEKQNSHFKVVPQKQEIGLLIMLHVDSNETTKIHELAATKGIMSDFIIRPASSEDKLWIEPFMIEHWGATSAVAHGVIYYPHDLSGFVAIQNKVPVGLVTYHISGNACEIVTLDSEHSGIGIGSALIASVKNTAKQSGCTRLWLVTTNDNLDALGFYQKRGFVLVQIHRNAIEHSRRLKPSIPLYGIDSIPIRDEIELEMLI